ncbi:hypothetical protein C9374_014629 [Naegleria lovaniensis]|uniref:Membrane insertase YidC/Oxa/ALB C-terminal domain-containing protein n=1 Tax=Naegleria lovaniensis TaxID=51637 RepID=A0AA88KPK9_NAELO|nr:uncharacterized protein C9374_014629 [Naegleria lovaniensis]KAG2389229.1 hypothetical protein C9374_014629 [Naegleria lovaniensis]
MLQRTTQSLAWMMKRRSAASLRSELSFSSTLGSQSRRVFGKRLDHANQRREFSWSTWLGSFGRSANPTVANNLTSATTGTTATTTTIQVASPVVKENVVATNEPTTNQVLSDASSQDDTFNGLQFIHETADYEYRAPLTFGEEHEMFLGGHLPNQAPHIHIIQDFLQYMHDTIGLPWYGAIMACTIVFRLLVLPLNISLIRNSARLDTVRIHLNEQAQIMSDSHATEEDKLKAAEEFQKTLKEKKCHPAFNILSPLVMAPMFLSVFLSVERICLHDPGCRGSGGIMWFQDLSAIDPTMTLPVISAVTWLITVEMGAAEPRTETMRQVRSVMRFVTAVMVPITGALPSGVFVYWITSNVFSMIQIYTMRLPAVRKFFNIPTKDVSNKYIQHNRDISM